MRNQMIFNGLCLIITVGALGVAAWALLSGTVAQQGVDGWFLLLVSLLVAFTFSLAPVQALRRGLLTDVLKQFRVRFAGFRGRAESPLRTVRTASDEFSGRTPVLPGGDKKAEET